MTRFEEIQQRLAEINAAAQNPDTSADELNQLNSETDQLRSEMEQIETRQRVLERSGGMRHPKPAEPTRADESRAAQFKANRGGQFEIGELRAVTVAGSDLVDPVGYQNSLEKPIGVPHSSIIDMVKAVNLNGMTEYRVPRLKAYGAAGVTAENTAVSADGTPTFDYATIKPITVATYTEVSRETQNLEPAMYMNEIAEAERVVLRAQLAKFITEGDGQVSPVMVGIKADDAVSGDYDLSVTGVDEHTLRNIALNYGGDEAVEGNAVLFLNKEDLIAFGDVRGTNEKRYVYEITPDTANPNTGIIRDGGLSVRYCICSNLTSLADADATDITMIYGAPAAYTLGIFSPVTVRVSEDYAFKNRMLAVLGEVMVGGAVTVEDGFLFVKKKVQLTLTYEAGEGGTVDPESETLYSDETPSGSTATADDGYHFVNWTDADGDEVSTDAEFVPESATEDATYTANFEADPEDPEGGDPEPGDPEGGDPEPGA